MRDVLKQPAFTERFITTSGWPMMAASPAETDQMIQSELPTIRDMTAAAGVKPQ